MIAGSPEEECFYALDIFIEEARSLQISGAKPAHSIFITNQS